VGESGCGKSVTALSVMRLVPGPAGRIAGGVVRFRDRDLLALPEEEMRAVRGREIAMIFQEPMTSLNPTLTIGRQLTEGPRSTSASNRRQRGRARSSCSYRSGSPIPTGGFATTRTSGAAACASGS